MTELITRKYGIFNDIAICSVEPWSHDIYWYNPTDNTLRLYIHAHRWVISAMNHTVNEPDDSQNDLYVYFKAVRRIIGHD